MTVLRALPQSLTKLELFACLRTVTTTLLPSIKQGPTVDSLRELRLVYAQQSPSGTATGSLTQQEMDFVAAFEQKGHQAPD